jgi:DNA-binding IclR family transcriptional regulator
VPNPQATVEDKSVHRKVIRMIDTAWSTGHPFSPREVARAAGVSKTSVMRVLDLLLTLKLVNHNEKAFRGRHYTVSHRWAGADTVIRSFEFGKVVGL